MINNAGKVRVLTVDDDKTIRKLVSMYLKSKGYQVIEASDGLAGLETFKQQPVDLVLLDLRMPGLDGLEVLAEIKKEQPDMPVIVFSGTEKISDAVKAIRLGAWDYVLKPIQELSVLLHSVEKALERAQLIKENQRYQQQLEADIEKQNQELREANLSLLREINERKRAEQALAENEKAYRAVFNASTACIFVVDYQTNAILEANTLACLQYGYSWQELQHLDLKLLIAPLHHSLFDSFLEKTKSTKHMLCELLCLHKDKSTFICEASSTVVSFKGYNQILAVFRDITLRKKTEEKEKLHLQQLIQADKMASLGVLVSGVAHEINNPNNFIIVNAPILSKIWKTIHPILKDHYNSHGDFYVAPRVRYTEMKDKIPVIISGILDGAKRINNFINELKNFARPSPSILDHKININKVIQSALTLLDNLVKRSTNHFSIHYGKKIPALKGNFQKLEQVIMNLVENSCQALENQNQALSISTSYDPNLHIVKITVHDEGIGMSPDIMSKIKQAFFTSKRNQGGTGLGLSISSRIIEEHGGKLEFLSSPGKGTTATVLLPTPGLEIRTNPN